MLATEAFRFDFFAMGTPSEVLLYAGDHGAAQQAATETIAEVDRIERLYSRYLPESYLSQINRAAKSAGSICVDSETADLIDIIFEAFAMSDGLFDVTSGPSRDLWNDDIATIPAEADVAGLRGRIGLDKVSWRRPRLSFSVPGMELDFGGIAKEYAVDRVAALCRSKQLTHGLVNLGGDVGVIGPHPDGSPWRIGIRDPKGGNRALATLFAGHGGIATSGDYERYWEIGGRRFSHVINPKTAWPVEGLPSITVAAETCLSAGIAATIALLKGKSGPQWLLAAGAAHLYVDQSGELGGSILAGNGTDR